MGRAPRLKVCDVEPLITKYDGVVLAIAAELKVTRQAAYQFIAKHEPLQRRVHEAQESMTDLAQLHFNKRVRRGDPDAVDKQLWKTVSGRRRGYTAGDDTEMTERVAAVEFALKVLNADDDLDLSTL